MQRALPASTPLAPKMQEKRALRERHCTRETAACLKTAGFVDVDKQFLHQVDSGVAYVAHGAGAENVYHSASL